MLPQHFDDQNNTEQRKYIHHGCDKRVRHGYRAVLEFVQKYDILRAKQNARHEPNDPVHSRQDNRWLEHDNRGANFHELHPVAYRLHEN